ncbi:MAG: hypothetical protein WA213_16755 [Terriglobales bacterium]
MKKDLWKRMVGITCGALLVLGTGVASAQSSSSSQSSTQSLGDAARAARKNKPHAETATHVYDNDNLPTTETLSVVGPAPSAQTSTGQQAAAQEASAAEQRQKTADDIQNKLDAQKAKIDQLSHDLEQDQREYRLRAAEFYNDAGNRLRNAGQWDKEGIEYRSDMDSKQKALDDAKTQLSDLQEQARKAGVREKDNDGTTKSSDKENTDNKDKDK